MKIKDKNYQIDLPLLFKIQNKSFNILRKVRLIMAFLMKLKNTGQFGSFGLKKTCEPIPYILTVKIETLQA